VVTINTRKRNEKGTVHLTARKNPASKVRRYITERLARPNQMRGKTTENPPKRKKK